MTYLGHIDSHPVTNEYMPIQFRDDEFLRKEGDTTGKTWDEDALRQWEFEENGGRPWLGRPSEVEKTRVGGSSGDLGCQA